VKFTDKLREYANETLPYADSIGGLLVRPALYVIAGIVDVAPDFVSDKSSDIQRWIRDLSQALEVAKTFNSKALIKNFTSLPKKLYTAGIEFKNGKEDQMDTWMVTSGDKRVVWSHQKIENSNKLWISIGQPNSNEQENEPTFLNAEEFFQPGTDITQFRIETDTNDILRALGLPDQVRLRYIRQTIETNGYVTDIESTKYTIQADPHVWLNSLQGSLPIEMLSNLESINQK
jgi:hypothetical protein